MFEIKYTIKVVLSLIATGNIVDLSDNFTTNLDLPNEQLYDNYHVIEQGNILDILKDKVDTYLKYQNLTRVDVEVESYEILSQTSNVDIFFENADNPNEYTLTPTIKVYIHPVISLVDPPVLNGELINSTSIMWTWDAQQEKDYAHYLLGNDDSIIAQLPVNLNYYIESPLRTETMYTRKLIKYNANSSSKASVSVSITTGTDKPVLNLSKYVIAPNEDYDKTPITVIPELLPAFHSGIGDDKDLLVVKQSDDEFYEKFGLDMKVLGVYHKNKSVYDQVSFNYRIKATGQYITREQPGNMDLIVHAYPVEHITYRVYKYGLKPVTGNYRVSCDCHYFIEIAVPAVDTNGNPYMQIIYEPAMKTFTSNSYPFSFIGTATYNPTLGFATSDFLSEVNAKPISDIPLMSIMQSSLDADPSISASGQGYTTNNFQIQDDYQFDETNNRYTAYGSRILGNGIYGTLKTCAKDGSAGYDKNSLVYVYGFSEGCLFDIVKYVTHEINLLEGTKAMLTRADLVTDNLINVSDSSQILSYTDGSIITIAEISYIEEDIINDYINVLSDPVTTCHINPSGPTAKFQSERLTYDFSSDDPYTMVVGCYTVKGIDMSHGIDPITNLPINIFSKREYMFIPEILVTSGNIDIGLNQRVIVGQSMTYRGEANYGIPLFSNLVDVTNEWETILPNPASTDALYGIVNGRFDITTAFSGKKDLQVVMPIFQIPSYVIPGTVRYSVELSNIYPVSSFISSTFTTRDADNYGVLNGDIITFSSDSMMDKSMEYTDLIETIKHNGLEMFSVTEKEFDFTLHKPIILKDKSYEVFNLQVLPDSNNITVSSAPATIVYDNNDEFKLILKIKGQQNATSHWSPRVHNGYYYLNNHEHFLYSEFKADGDFRPIQRFVEDQVDYTITCTLKKPGGQIRHYTVTKKQEHEYISDRSIFDFKNGMLFPQPTLNTKYYKEYTETIYTSPTIIVPEIVTSYDNITWENIIPFSSSLSVWMRVFNVDDSTNGIWEDWVQVFSESPMNLLPSSAIQFKVIFEPKTTNVYEDFNEIDCCEIDYTETIDESISTNISYQDDILKCLDANMPAQFYSTILDYGSTTTLKLASYDNGKGITMWVAGSNDNVDLKNNPQWVQMTGSNGVGRYRYLRYKINIPAGGELYLLYRYLNAPVTACYVPEIGNIAMYFTHVEPDKFYTFSQDFSTVIPYDTQWHSVAPTISGLIYPIVATSGFDPTDITSLDIKPKDNVSEIQFDMNSLDKGIQIRSLSTEYDTSLKSQYINFINDTCTIIGIPQQFCPVIVQDDTIGSLQLVSFYDESGNATLTNTEILTSHLQKCFKLNYNFIDSSTLVVKQNTQVVDSTKYKLYNNIIEFNDLIDEDVVIDVSYIIRNSFYVDSDIENNKTIIKVHTDSPLLNARVMFETSQVDNKNIVGHLSLNPIYNLDNKGFVFICYDTFPVLDFTIHANPVTLKADGQDTTGIYVSVTDVYNNPVPGETLNITCSYGRIDIDNYMTDINGVVAFRYTSPKSTCFDTITVVCESINLTKTITIANTREV